MRDSIATVALAALLCGAPMTAWSKDEAAAKPADKTEPAKDVKEATPASSVTHHQITVDGVKNPTLRPVTFAFNGGPGSSSIWLHMGIRDPRRVVVNDVVMIDPVGFIRATDRL
jgi:carboxypeptidase C (cathepsin A)